MYLKQFLRKTTNQRYSKKGTLLFTWRRISGDGTFSKVHGRSGESSKKRRKMSFKEVTRARRFR